MTLFVSWFAFPLVLALLSIGCGLLVESACGVRLPVALLPPLGYALIVVVGSLLTHDGGTANLAAPAVVACAVAGIALSPGRRSGVVAPLAAGSLAYLVYAAPTLFSGRATFAGYIKLDDTATYLAMLDRVIEHGRSIEGLPPSTYEATLATSLDYGYPVGSLVPLGVAHRLVGTDAAWLWQPHIAFLGALLAFALYSLASPLVRPRVLRAAIAVVAAQPALLYGYSLWGGVKEVAAAALVASAAALVVPMDAGPRRSSVPLAVVCAALLGVLSIGGVVWVGPLVAGAAVIVVRERGVRFAAATAGIFVTALVLCSIPAIVSAVEWLPRSRGFASESELANLIRPLRWIQTFGIWPVGDFRREPGDPAPAYVLIAVTAVAALAGLVFAARRRRLELPLYAATVAIAAFAVAIAGSPWVEAKAFATASPAVLLLALVACAVVGLRGRPTEAAVAAAAVVGGVVWSNALAYTQVWLAPQSRLAELELIGERFSGQGPALMTEFEPYGARHFLRTLDPEGASELRRRLVNLRTGGTLPPQGYADVDAFGLADLLVYRTLVLRRSPVASAPPSPYRISARGDWYDVWQRPASGAPRVVEHLPLGDELQPGAKPACAEVLRLARRAGVQRLVAVERAAVQAISLAALPHPASWQASGASVYADTAGRLETTFEAPAEGAYELWVGGTFLRPLELRLDGRHIGSARHQLEWSGQFVRLGTLRLAAGQHRIELRLGDDFEPGAAGVPPFPLGPVVVAPARAPAALSVPPAGARLLCGRRLDWVEAIGS